MSIKPTHAGLHPIFKNILDSQFAFNFQNTDDCCSNCQKCTVYENENRKPSKKYYCEDTDDFIDDIEQHCCDNFEREQ